MHSVLAFASRCGGVRYFVRFASGPASADLLFEQTEAAGNAEVAGHPIPDTRIR